MSENESKVIRVDSDIYDKIFIFQTALQLKRNKRLTMSDALRELLSMAEKGATLCSA